MRRLLTLIAVTSALAAPLAAHAQLNFDFSFTNTGGNAAGTVTGEIFGLTNNATSAPTDIVVTSYPAAITGLPAAPWDIYTIPGFEFGNHGTPELADHFTVTNGAITDATYSLFTATGQSVLYFNWGGVDFFANHPEVGGAFVIADPSTAIFTQVSGGVPEPAAWALMISGLFGVGAMLRRRAAGAALA
jgi:hypothetical protein